MDRDSELRRLTPDEVREMNLDLVRLKSLRKLAMRRERNYDRLMRQLMKSGYMVISQVVPIHAGAPVEFDGPSVGGSS